MVLQGLIAFSLPNSTNPSTSPTATPSSRVTPTSSPVTFAAVYGQGGLNQGIGGWDFQNSSDRSFPFDYDHNGKLDYMVTYRPGLGAIYILKNANGTFTPVYQQAQGGKGIGNFDLHAPGTFAFAFDYEHSGNLDYLVFYIPGEGTIWILKNVNGKFSAVYAEGSPGNNIGGYDFSSPQDRAFAFDYDHSGRLDHIAIYRPGNGTFWILANVNGKFSPVYKGSPGNGIGGYNLASTADVALAFDYAQSGRMDYIILYRPGTGTISILEHGAGNNNFTAVYQQGDPGSGIGGFGISSPADLAFAFDYASAGRQDYLVFYRPGTGIFWILQNSNGTFEPVYGQTDPGVGIGGYDLSSPMDLAYAFDYKQSGNLNHIVLYRPGYGLVYIVEKS
jgi:hypothetical protein